MTELLNTSVANITLIALHQVARKAMDIGSGQRPFSPPAGRMRGNHLHAVVGLADRLCYGRCPDRPSRARHFQGCSDLGSHVLSPGRVGSRAPRRKARSCAWARPGLGIFEALLLGFISAGEDASAPHAVS